MYNNFLLFSHNFLLILSVLFHMNANYNTVFKQNKTVILSLTRHSIKDVYFMMSIIITQQYKQCFCKQQ